MTAGKAKKELSWMLEETRGSEEELASNQELLGDACRELRIANFLPRRVVAERLGWTEAKVRAAERRVGTAEADQFAAACEPLD